MKLTETVKEEIIKHCIREVPHQACGLVLFDKKHESTKCVETTNFGAWPYGFQISPDELFLVALNAKKKGQQIKGVYHCHLASNADITDRDKFRYVPDGMLYIIVSVLDKENPEFKCYYKVDGLFTEVD